MSDPLHALLREKILLLDGAMGTMIQRARLAEEDYRGARFRDWPRELRGNNDLLSLTQPRLVRDIHTQYLQAGADVIETNTFNSTSIDQLLRNMGINRLWVTGIVTEGCVEMTARDAADRGLLVTLVSDGCASSTHVAHEDALQRMGDGGLIKVRTVDELIGQLVAVPV